MSYGYMGKMLWVDLSANKITSESLDYNLARRFIGGYGIGARIIFDRQKKGADPLGPESILGFITGPFTGTSILGGSRYTVVGKSPLTGGWGDSNSGGDFGPYLKFSGYDAVFFTGISEKPVYLFINEGKAELRDASNIWGKDTHESEEIIKSELGDDIRMACIGPAGERLSLIACIINNRGRAAGRSGLGAVMGSKRVKALVVRGKDKVPVADEEKVNNLRRKYINELSGNSKWMRDFGTAYVAFPASHNGDSPVKNWGGIGILDYPDNKSLHPDNMMNYKISNYGCYRCPVACGAIVKNGLEYSYVEGSHRPEYETIAMFGPNCLNNNFESIIKLNEICNRYGLDTISAGAVIAFTIECYEAGLISKSNTDGIEMNWGNHSSIVAMTEKVARREGFGDIVADGVKLAAEKIGKDSEKYAMHIMGQEVPAHDPKFSYEWGLGYVLDPTPAKHTQRADVFRPMFNPEVGEGVTGRKDYQKIAKDYRLSSALHHVMNSSGICGFIFSFMPNEDVMVEFLDAVTGWDVGKEELIEIGERILNMRQVFNIREGLSLSEIKVPGRVLGSPPQTAGPLKGKTFDTNLIEACMKELSWDLRTSKPSKEKLLALKIGDLIQEIY